VYAVHVSLHEGGRASGVRRGSGIAYLMVEGVDELCSRTSLHGLNDLPILDGGGLLLITSKFLSLEYSRVRDQSESVLLEGKVHAATI
jgi:hypothetical protein